MTRSCFIISFLLALGMAALYCTLSFYIAMPDIFAAMPNRVLLITGIVFLGTLATMLLLFYTSQIYNKILIAMLGGALFGVIFGPVVSEYIAPVGTIFIRLLKMIVVPLVFASLVLGVISLGDIKKLGRIGGKTLLYFIFTTAVAILTGLILSNQIQPGKYVSEKDRQKFEEQYRQKVETSVSVKPTQLNLKDMIVNTVPTNPVEAMAKGDMLAIIFFAVFFGVLLGTIPPEKRTALEKGLEGLNEVMVQMVMSIMKIAPLGVFALIADSIAKTGISLLGALFVYSLVVIGGFILQVILVYGPLLYIFARYSLWEFLQKVWPVEVVAFSTSSSSATLPLTLRCTEEELKVPKNIGSFVVSLGCTINMNGTALYLGVAALFIAQVFNIPLDWTQQTTILIVATISAIGTPGIPGGSIVFLAMILETINVPAIGIALVLGVDRIIDMFRTTINVMGDMTAALFVYNTEKEKSEHLESTQTL